MRSSDVIRPAVRALWVGLALGLEVVVPLVLARAARHAEGTDVTDCADRPRVVRPPGRGGPRQYVVAPFSPGRKKELETMFGYGNGGGWLLMIVMMIALLAVVVGVVLLVVRLGRGSNANVAASNGANVLLDERFARGDITEEQYVRQRQVLRLP